MSLPIDIMSDRGFPAGFPWERAVPAEDVVDVAPAPAAPVDCSVRMAAMEFAVRVREPGCSAVDVVSDAVRILAFLEGRG